MLQPTMRVWRYLSFSKLVWMLQNKQLWLSNANFLDDKWEIMPIGQQLNTIINTRPPSISAKEVYEKTEKTIKELRKQTFINCWTASEYESHALWHIYCSTSEGVAIQTTLGRLKDSVGGIPVLEVSYDSEEDTKSIPDVYKLVTQKRPMFAYESEVRVVLVNDFADIRTPGREIFGTGIKWDPELNLEGIWIHPEAGHWFAETVTETVRQLAPNLSREGIMPVWWSKLNSPPPF